MRRKPKLLRTVGNAALTVVILPFLPFILALALIAVILHLLYRVALYLLIWSLWLPKGKDILFIFSDSPIWREYMATELLPLVEERAIVLNWSRRKTWSRWSLSVAAFRHFGGHRAFNPMIVIFRPFHTAKAFRFWAAFREWKQGNRQSIDRLRADLLAVL